MSTTRAKESRGWCVSDPEAYVASVLLESARGDVPVRAHEDNGVPIST